MTSIIAGEEEDKSKSDTRSTTTLSTISTAEIKSIVERLKMDRFRSSTKSTYYTVWKLFNQFFIKLDTKPATWEERLVLFVGYLIETKKKSSTIHSYISAICAVLREDGEILNEDSFLLASLTKACKYKNDRVRTRLPIRKGLLKLMISAIHEIYGNTQPYLTILYQAMFITAYYGLFRVGEITMSQHVIKAKDVHIGVNKR